MIPPKNACLPIRNHWKGENRGNVSSQTKTSCFIIITNSSQIRSINDSPGKTHLFQAMDISLFPNVQIFEHVQLGSLIKNEYLSCLISNLALTIN